MESTRSSLQYAYRAEKSLGLVSSAPDWTPVDVWVKPEGQTKTSAYAPDGRLYAVAHANGIAVYDVTTAENALLGTIPVKAAVEISFSPKGTYLSSWVRHIKLEDGAQHNNLQIWSTAFSGDESSEIKEVVSYAHKLQEGWALQFTDDESRASRSVTGEVHILDPAKGFSVVDKVRVENLTSYSLSPGTNPSVACFVSEKKGMPARVIIHSLATIAIASIQKSFFKADRGQMKWNASGTSLLFLSSTDHDKTGKSYYGETNLYLLTPALQYDARVALDKEGHIGDFAWNPANGGKEFVVTYGFMPAKATLFDLRLNVLHEFGSLSRNFVSFNPQGRLLCIAGFGNLAGNVDIWDRSTLKKVASFQASNSTQCTWSPSGRLLMCATLSPRLRVDNGIKIYHWNGDLIHHDIIDELYQAAWRPQPVANSPFPRSLSSAPAPSAAVQAMLAAKAAAKGETAGTASPKPVAVGAYRPPGLRGRETPAIYGHGGESSGPQTTSKGKPGIPGLTAQKQPDKNGRGSKGRSVPGAGPPQNGQAESSGSRKGGKKGGKKENGTPTQELQDMSLGGANGAPAAEAESASVPATPAKSALAHVNGVSQDNGLSAPLTPEDKKRRALQKKLGAIEALKAKRDAGEKLEKTQEKKIEAEEDVRKELREIEG